MYSDKFLELVFAQIRMCCAKEAIDYNKLFKMALDIMKSSNGLI